MSEEENAKASKFRHELTKKDIVARVIYQVARSHLLLDASGVHLEHANLEQVDLAQARLQGSKVTGANLTMANFSHADFTEADLSGAKFTGANLSNSYLPSANLNGAILVRTDFTEANLRKANFANTIQSRVTFTNADLTDADFTGAHILEVAGGGEKLCVGRSFHGAKISPGSGLADDVQKILEAKGASFYDDTNLFQETVDMVTEEAVRLGYSSRLKKALRGDLSE